MSLGRRSRIALFVEGGALELRRAEAPIRKDPALERGAIEVAHPELVGIALGKIGVAAVGELLARDRIANVRRRRAVRAKRRADERKDALR